MGLGELMSCELVRVPRYLVENVPEGINRHTVQVNLVVQMGPGRAARTAHERNGLTAGYILALLHKGLLQMSILRE